MFARVSAPILIFVLMFSAFSTQVPTGHADMASSRSAVSLVVTNYSTIFNNGMKTGDFSAMASVFAADAVFTQSSPKGVTKVYHGLKEITAAFTALQKTIPGYQWTIDSMRSLDQWTVLVYEHAGSPPLSVPGRCVHIFQIINGKIRSYDWITYFPGQP